MRYLQINVSTTHDGADLVASLMFDEGSDGIEIRDGADVRELIEKKISWDYVDESLLKPTDGKVSVIGFFPLDFSPARLEAALSELKTNRLFRSAVSKRSPAKSTRRTGKTSGANTTRPSKSKALRSCPHGSDIRAAAFRCISNRGWRSARVITKQPRFAFRSCRKSESRASA